MRYPTLNGGVLQRCWGVFIFAYAAVLTLHINAQLLAPRAASNRPIPVGIRHAMAIYPPPVLPRHLPFQNPSRLQESRAAVRNHRGNTRGSGQSCTGAQ